MVVCGIVSSPSNLHNPPEGDLHIAIYDLTHNIMHVANARRDNVTGPVKAYDRMFIRFNMTELFAEPQQLAVNPMAALV